MSVDPARLAALEAVAEAARVLQNWQPDRMTQPSAAFMAWGKLNSALLALRFAPALSAPAQAQGETVTLGLIRAVRSGSWAATEQPEQEDPRDWVHVGNLTFTPPPPAQLPTIRATVKGGGE